jgi:phytoene desaturase
MSAAAGEHDAVVLGAGVGGLVAAARLALAGRRPLVIESADRLGGRFSTIEVDGYRIPTGAVAIETAGPFWEIFGELGIDPGLRVPDPPVLIHVRGHDLKPGAAVWQHMIKRVTKTAGKVAENIAKARTEDEPGDDITLEQWAKKYTHSKTLLSLFQSLSAAIFTVNADELAAGVFFRLLRETGGYKSYGFAPEGNVAVADAIAAAVEERGGRVLTGWTATGIEIEDGRAVAVSATDPDGAEQRLAAEAVISNIGPRQTAGLLAGTELEAEFAERVRDVRTTSLLALAFSSAEEIVPHPGIWAFTDTERLCNLANLTATCPELAPPGRKLYEAYSAPLDRRRVRRRGRARAARSRPAQADPRLRRGRGRPLQGDAGRRRPGPAVRAGHRPRRPHPRRQPGRSRRRGQALRLDRHHRLRPDRPHRGRRSPGRVPA